MTRQPKQPQGAKAADTVLTRHPDPAKQGTRVDRARYEQMRAAMLAEIPIDPEGIGYRDLPDRVGPHLDPESYRGRSVRWHIETVKQDLLARGLIEILPGRGPQKLRATQSIGKESSP